MDGGGHAWAQVRGPTGQWAVWGGADTAENGHDKEQRVNVSEARGGRLGRARKTWEGRAEVRETDKSQSKDRRKEERPGGGEGGAGPSGGSWDGLVAGMETGVGGWAV